MAHQMLMHIYTGLSRSLANILWVSGDMLCYWRHALHMYPLCLFSKR